MQYICDNTDNISKMSQDDLVNFFRVAVNGFEENFILHVNLSKQNILNLMANVFKENTQKYRIVSTFVRLLCTEVFKENTGIIYAAFFSNLYGANYCAFNNMAYMGLPILPIILFENKQNLEYVIYHICGKPTAPKQFFVRGTYDAKAQSLHIIDFTKNMIRKHIDDENLEELRDDIVKYFYDDIYQRPIEEIVGGKYLQEYPEISSHVMAPK